MMPQVKFPKCKRGIFGLSTWDVQRKPGKQPNTPPTSPSNTQPLVNGTSTNVQQLTVQRPAVRQPAVQPPTVQPKKKQKQVISKYTYNANAASPLGKELCMKPGDRLTVITEQNEHWWLARNAQGEEGYIPASYVMVHEVNELPWLASQRLEEEEEEEEEVVHAPMATTFGTAPQQHQEKSNTFKPYVSAYNRDEGASEDSNRWRCDICDKTLNGPKPYSAHMNSKAHKEEVEYAQETGRL